MPCTLFSNFFKVVSHPRLMITKLKASVEPELATGETRNWMERKLFHLIGKELRTAIPWFVRIGTVLYVPSTGPVFHNDNEF